MMEKATPKSITKGISAARRHADPVAGRVIVRDETRRSIVTFHQRHPNVDARTVAHIFFTLQRR